MIIKINKYIYTLISSKYDVSKVYCWWTSFYFDKYLFLFLVLFYKDIGWYWFGYCDDLLYGNRITWDCNNINKGFNQGYILISQLRLVRTLYQYLKTFADHFSQTIMQPNLIESSHSKAQYIRDYYQSVGIKEKALTSYQQQNIKICRTTKNLWKLVWNSDKNSFGLC